MKEQDKTPEKQLNEVEIGNLPEEDLHVMEVCEGEIRLEREVAANHPNCFLLK